MQLTAKQVQHLTTPGRYGDGGNLYLQVRSATSRLWLFRYMLNGKAHEMSLGSYPAVSLADARSKAMRHRDELARGIDPMQAREAVEALAVRNRTTFRDAIEACLTVICHGWDATHAQTWRNSLLRDHIPASLLDLPVAAISRERVLDILSPIWTVKTPTASNLRMRIERVLAFAIAKGWHDGPNPALWRGNLRDLLPLPTRAHKQTPHVAIDWRVVPGVYQAIMAEETVGRLALAFTLLTGARISEALDAPWSEIDLDLAVWTIPAERMKAERPHRVPLAAPALAILRRLLPLARKPADLIFPGQKRGRAVSKTTPRSLLRSISGVADADTHGLRATFRDWIAETTSYPNHVAEMALAHAIGSKVEASYRRGDLFAQRMALMADWAAYLVKPPAEVVPLRRGRQAA